MNALPLLIVVPALLALGSWILGSKFAQDYKRHGALSPVNIALGSLVWIGWGGLPYFYLPTTWPEVEVGATWSIIGHVLLFGGLVLLLAGMITLGFGRSFGRTDEELREGGVYRFSRNPQIAGCALYALGFGLLWPSWYVVLWLAVFAVLAHIMVVTEEKHLYRTFGPHYRNYSDRVRRYL